MELTIVEKNGWKKSVKFEKAIIRIGSDSANEVQLASPEISPVQLQLHYLKDNPSTCKVLNLGSDVVVWQNQSQAVLPPYAITPVSNGSEIVLGEYRIQFKLPFAARTIADSRSIQASLHFPDATLSPDRKAVGILSLKNTGLESACQFEVVLQGLPADCMQVDPVPLLYPGAQEDVRVQLFHRKLYPTAGAQELAIEVFSPASYPGEQVIIRQGIYVTPVLEHTVKIIDDMSREEQGEEVQAVTVGVLTPIVDHTPTPPAREAVSPSVDIVATVSSVETKPIISAPPVETNPQETSVIVEQPRPVTPQIAPAPPKNTQANSFSETPLPIQSQKKPENHQEKTKKLDNPPAISESDPGSTPIPKPRVVRSPSDDFWDEE